MVDPQGVTSFGSDELTIARAVLAAARSVQGVTGISPGRHALARTVGLGGMAVEGVQLTPSTAGLQVEVHIVVDFIPIPPLAAAVRDAVAAVLHQLDTPVATVDVWVDALRVAEPEEGRR